MIVAVLCVRDDADVLTHSLPHMLGTADLVLATDHCSTDGTREILRSHGDRVELFAEKSDPTFAHQAEWTNAMAQEATRRGAKWVIPFDADEFFVPAGRPAVTGRLAYGVVTYPHPPPPRPPLRESLLSLAGHGPLVLPCRVFEHATPLLRSLTPEPLPKVILTAADGRAQLSKGAHAVRGHRGPQVEHVAEVRHWAYRSFEQFLAKTKKHLLSQEAYGPSGPHNDHYRERAGKPDSELRNIYEAWVERCSQVRDPIAGVSP